MTRVGGVVDRFDGDGRVRTDGAVDPLGGPAHRGVVAGDLLDHGAFGSADPPGRREPRLSEHAHAHHVVLPLGEPVRSVVKVKKSLRALPTEPAQSLVVTPGAVRPR